MGPTNLNEVVKTIKIEEVVPFSLKIIHAKTKTMFLGSNMHMMMHTLEEGDRLHLPHGLSIMNTYTKMTTGSKGVVVMVKNLTAAQVTNLRESRLLELWL